MHQLPQVTSGAVRFRTENSGSSLDLSALTTFNATSSGAILETDIGATLDVGNLTTLDNVALTVGGAASVSQITTVTNGSIAARDGATATFSGLTTFTSDGFFAYTAGVLNLPTVASYTAPLTGSRFEAGDAGSQINLPNLTTFNGAFNGNTAYVHVYGGASIDMHYCRRSERRGLVPRRKLRQFARFLGVDHVQRDQYRRRVGIRQRGEP